jgi:BirA family biotin operon repressor/biotin-[acetyl-CoA-carboxylase] ligase
MAGFPNSAGGAAVVYFETIGSTNAEALARAKAGVTGPLWIAAESQTAGRGRRGRAWVSEPGNLYASLLLTEPAPAATAAQLCFVAALALHDAVLESCHGLAPADLKLKWPNDLLLGGRKIAGILVAGVSLAGGRGAAAIGFGVNCRHHPEGVEFPAADLARCGFSVSPMDLLTALGRSMRYRLDEWDRGGNFSAVRSAWLARASGVGQAIEVRLPDRALSGTFEAVDADGALVLKHADGKRETINAGDVFPLTAG